MKLLVTGAFLLNESEKERFLSAGYEITEHPDERSSVKCPEQYDAVICNGLFLYNPIENFTNLKIIQLTSAGKDRVSLDYIAKNGIQLFTAENTYSIPMAEWAITSILTIYKNVSFFLQNQDEKKWEKDRNIRELFGKTALIYGFGNAGREIAKRLKAFDCYVIAADIRTEDAGYADELLGMRQADACLPTADIVVVTLPLCPDTVHYFHADRLTVMRENAVLVNLSRGGIVDEAALADCLTSGKLLGAALDVFEKEPLPAESPLWTCKSLLLTPHNSFVGEHNRERLLAVIVKNLISGRDCA